jgi:hypothetical protein
MTARARRNCSLTEGSLSSSWRHALSGLLTSSVDASSSVSAAPALVMPLLNRSIQIQPPRNT